MNSQIHTNFNGFTITEGQLVSDRVSRIVEAIREYEPEIEVRWIPDRQSVAENKPQFTIVHCPPDGREFTLFHVKNEDEFDETVLLRIIANDQRHGKHTLSEFEAAETAKKLIEKQVWLDAMEEMQDKVKHVIKSNLNTYKVDNDLTIKEGIPFNANRLRDPKFISHNSTGSKGKKK